LYFLYFGNNCWWSQKEAPSSKLLLFEQNSGVCGALDTQMETQTP